jgi:hypothetical protein
LYCTSARVGSAQAPRPTAQSSTTKRRFCGSFVIYISIQELVDKANTLNG